MKFVGGGQMITLLLSPLVSKYRTTMYESSSLHVHMSARDFRVTNPLLPTHSLVTRSSFFFLRPYLSVCASKVIYTIIVTLAPSSLLVTCQTKVPLSLSPPIIFFPFTLILCLN